MTMDFFIEHGDEIMEGLYYQQLGQNKGFYLLLKDKSLTFINSHLVISSKFAMIHISHK
jgi:hypothetical protein